MENKDNCDPVTGVCAPASLAGELASQVRYKEDTEFIYVGDPMCSWCWGISPALKEIKNYTDSLGINFRIVVGGLRPGGGDPWNQEMKNFLKHHWEEVTKRSGQPFGYALFDREEFNYDTEPPCRAFVAARKLLTKEQELPFFTAIKKKFYVDSQDPGKESFYASLCDDFNIAYNRFLDLFHSAEVKKETHAEFVINRQWGVQGYPATVLKTGDKLWAVANGYTSYQDLKTQLDAILETHATVEDIAK